MISLLLISAAVILYLPKQFDSPAAASESASCLASLTGQADRAILEYRSEGCGGGSSYWLEYTPVPTPRITVIDLHSWRRGPLFIGTVALSLEQVTLLDNTLLFFRNHNRNGGCTTRDTLEVTLYKGREKRFHEVSDDTTCSRRNFEDANPQDLRALMKAHDWKGVRFAPIPVLSLDHVIATAQRAQKSDGSMLPYPSVKRQNTYAYNGLANLYKQRANLQQARQWVHDLPGSEAMHQQFQVHNVMLGNVNRFPYAMDIELTARSPYLIDAEWFNPVTNNKPQFDWNRFLRTERHIERAVARHRWLKQWKEAGTGRTVETQILGVTPVIDDEFEQPACPAWKHAGLRGMPAYQIFLYRNDRTAIEIYLGDQDSRALVVSAELPTKGKPAFWLDNIQLSYDAVKATPQCGIITPDGIWKRLKN